MRTPLLSVCLITYNHEKFIRQAIDGVLMQVVDFEWELIIADDCSTDKTTEIILEYKENHPNFIRLILQEKNVGAEKNWMDLLTAPKSKYIAYIEGDDYWTDPLKLQKQVDFLEVNPEYVITGHDARVIDQDGLILKKSKLTDEGKRDATSDELKKGFWLLSLTLVFRNIPILKNYPKEGKNVLNGDTFLISVLGQFGKYKYMPEIKPASYRVHNGGVWSMKSKQLKSMASLKTLFRMAKYHENKDVKNSKELFSWTFIKGHSMFISGLKQNIGFKMQLYTLRYTILAHYKIKGFNETILFSIKKIVRLIANPFLI